MAFLLPVYFVIKKNGRTFAALKGRQYLDGAVLI